jgi:hypothetical protein
MDDSRAVVSDAPRSVDPVDASGGMALLSKGERTGREHEGKPDLFRRLSHLANPKQPRFRQSR